SMPRRALRRRGPAPPVGRDMHRKARCAAMCPACNRGWAVFLVCVAPLCCRGTVNRRSDNRILGYGLLVEYPWNVAWLSERPDGFKICLHSYKLTPGRRLAGVVDVIGARKVSTMIVE